jgi:hypothetical protein
VLASPRLCILVIIIIKGSLNLGADSSLPSKKLIECGFYYKVSCFALRTSYELQKKPIAPEALARQPVVPSLLARVAQARTSKLVPAEIWRDQSRQKLWRDCSGMNSAAHNGADRDLARLSRTGTSGATRLCRAWSFGAAVICTMFSVCRAITFRATACNFFKK